VTALASADIRATRRAPRWQSRHLGPLLLAAPLVLYLLAFYALPVAAMLSRSVTDPSWTLANYARLAADPVFLRVLASTLITAAIVTAWTIVLGYPVAFAIARSRPAVANIVLVVVLLPFWTSVLVRSYAWMVLLGRHGLINEALTAAGIIASPLRLLNTSLAVYIAMIHILLPYAILPLASVLRQVDGALLRAAAGLGANPWRVFRQVVLPLSLPGVVVGMLLVFVLSLGFYITPALVGGPRDTMLSMLITQQVDLLNWPYAAALSTTLLAVALTLIGVALRLPALRQALSGVAR
jgi:ABC-type spermidine/putrescine transport system permease subunit I